MKVLSSISLIRLETMWKVANDAMPVLNVEQCKVYVDDVQRTDLADVKRKGPQYKWFLDADLDADHPSHRTAIGMKYNMLLSHVSGMRPQIPKQYTNIALIERKGQFSIGVVDSRNI